MQVGQIIEGHFNEIINKNQDISQKRLEICYKCPLYSPRFGGLCNNRLWLNVETGDVSTTNKIGYMRGCGCRLLAKTRVPEAHCPVNKW